MSKYNLTDILEQYRIGSGWTTDFDYDGMLKAGLKAGVDTDIEVLKKMSDDFEDVNYHRENSHLQNAIDALEEGAIKEASMFFGDFHAEIKQTIKDQGMDIEPTLGKFMDAKMDMMNEDEFDEARQSAIESSQEAAGIKEDKESRPHMSSDEFLRHIEKLHKDNQTQIAKEKEVKEVTSREGARIEGLLSIPLKSKFLEAFQDLYFDLVEEDPFMAEDVVDHLGIEMLKHLDAIQAQGDSLAGLDQQEFTAIDEEDSIEEVMGVDRKGNKKPDTDGSDATKFKKAAMSEDEKKYTDTVAKVLKDRILKDIPMDIIVDFVKTHGSDIRRMNNSEIKDEFEEFRSVNYDYIDENLKAHFNRFK